MGYLAPQWLLQAFDDAGNVASGAKLYSYVSGTTEPTPLYSDYACTTPLDNPCTLDSAGRIDIWLKEGISYRLRLESATGDVLEDRWPVVGSNSVSSADLRAVIGDSAEIVWTDEGDGLLGHLVWPLVPDPGSYVEAAASTYKAVAGGMGYGTDEIVARRNGAEASRFGVEWGYAGNDAWTAIGDLDATNIRFQPDAGGTGVDAYGSGEFKFDSLRVGDLAGGGENPLPVARNNAGGLVPQDAETFRDTIGLSWVEFPAPDPQRNHVGIVVPSGIGFIDNVLSIQNKSSGDWYGSTSYGNAAINFKDLAGTERCAVGYSRNSAIQPTGYIADTLYCEIGNPFTSDASATYFRVMATIMAGSPYWGGASKQWAPVEVSSRTGKITMDLGSGGEALNVINGPLVIGESNDVQPIRVMMTNSVARIREYGWSNYFGITTNISNLTTPYALDDATKSGWILGFGYGSGSGEFDSFQLKRVPVGGGAASTLLRLSNIGALNLSNLSGAGSRVLVTDASGNVSAGVSAPKIRSYAQMYRTAAGAAQAIANGSTYIKITPFDTNDTDYVDSTPDHTNDQITIGRAGRYSVAFTRSYSVSAANVTWHVGVLKNGVIVPASVQEVKTAATGTPMYANLCTQITCSAGDIITIGVYHDNGSSVNMTYEHATLSVNAID